MGEKQVNMEEVREFQRELELDDSLTRKEWMIDNSGDNIEMK